MLPFALTVAAAAAAAAATAATAMVYISSPPSHFPSPSSPL